MTVDDVDKDGISSLHTVVQFADGKLGGFRCFVEQCKAKLEV